MKTEHIRVMTRRAAKERQPTVPQYWRPQTRADCLDGPRPCPFVGCRYNLLVEVTAAGSIKMPLGAPWEADPDTPSCALDVADDGERTLQDIADILGISLQWVVQSRAEALRKMAALNLSEDDS